VRRCMALLAASARALLRELLRWQAPKHAEVARQCAEHLSHLYEDIAERKVHCVSIYDYPPRCGTMRLLACDAAGQVAVKIWHVMLMYR
jgi:hypothetical protein